MNGRSVRAALVVMACAVSLGAGVTAARADEMAERLDCAKEVHGLLSLKADTPTAITFINRTRHIQTIYWLNYGGQRVFYTRLAPGRRYRQETYVTHPWVVTSNETGTCSALFLPLDMPSTAVLR